MPPKIARHPQLWAWLALSLGMAAALLGAARGRGFSAGELAGLAALCLLLAGIFVRMAWWEA